MLSKPWSRKYRERILQERALTAHQPVVKDQEVASHPQEILARTERTDLVPKEIIELQQILKCRKIFASIVFADVLIPMLDLDAKNTWTMQHVQRLTDISSHGVSREHLSHP